MPEPTTFALRLPRSIRSGVEKISEQEGISMNQFVTIAIAEKLAVMQAQTYFTARAKNADLEVFDHVMIRKSGKRPREN